jgi:hypothetical protein
VPSRVRDTLSVVMKNAWDFVDVIMLYVSYTCITKATSECSLLWEA